MFLFLIIGTISDIRSRSVSKLLLVASGSSGILISIITGQTETGSLMNWLYGLLLGGVFIAISLISDNKLGMGDAISILIIGIYLGGCDSALAVLYAMMISAFFSVIIISLKKGSRNTELPFMPFLLSGCILQQIGSFL